MNNWITKFIKPGLKTLLKKVRPKPGEDSLWITCGGCQQLIYKEELYKNFFICPKCNEYQKITPRVRFRFFFDNGEFEILKPPLLPDDPINFIDTKKYTDRLKEARKKTNQECAVMIARGQINGINITTGAINFDFIGGSVASAEGEAIITGIQHAIDNKNPFVFFPCGGGQRMHESPIALAQMTRTTLAVNELKKNNLPYLVCFTDPTAGGITASFASLGDIIIAEPNCLIAFAGRRVIQATVKEDLPENFQRAEYVQECGFVDLIVERKDLKEKIGSLLSILLKKNSDINNEISDETSETNFETRAEAS